MISTKLHRELWTSWASLLRSYAAMHGLNSTHHAVVEVSADSILLRVDTRWLRFSSSLMESSEGASEIFQLHEDGTVTLGDKINEMDLTAEEVAREMLHRE